MISNIQIGRLYKFKDSNYKDYIYTIGEHIIPFDDGNKWFKLIQLEEYKEPRIVAFNEREIYEYYNLVEDL